MAKEDLFHKYFLHLCKIKYWLAKKGSISDEKLLEHYCSNGDVGSLGELYNRYIPLVYGVGLKYFKNSAEAEDAVSDIYIELSQKVQKYKVANFRTWLYSVVRNHCLGKLRADKKMVSVENSVDSIMELSDIDHLLYIDEKEQLYNRLGECMKKLSVQQKQCIQLFYIDKYSYAEVSDKTHYPLLKVKSYIQNGKRNLKSCLEANI